MFYAIFYYLPAMAAVPEQWRDQIIKKYNKDDATGKVMLSFTFRGSDSIIVANTTTKIVSGTGIANKAQIAPAANPIVHSNVIYVFHILYRCMLQNHPPEPV
jgi:hypothetical protein